MNDEQTDVKDWTKQQLDKAVHHFMDEGIFDEALIEAKPAWVLPFSLLIGKIRGRGTPHSFSWFVCGDCPILHLDGEAASTPREAARQFALNWQLQAHSEDQANADLIEKAESFYELTEMDNIWSA